MPTSEPLYKSVLPEDARILRLPINRYWFNIILQDVLVEDARKVNSYWSQRLIDRWDGTSPVFKTFDYLVFINGYQTDSPVIITECRGIRLVEPTEMTIHGPGPLFAIALGNRVAWIDQYIPTKHDA